MSDMTVTARIKVETTRMIAADIWSDGVQICVKQGNDAVLIDPAAIPALIAALQAAAAEVEGRKDE